MCWVIFTKNIRRTTVYTLLATDTVLPISNDNVLVPQKMYFTNDIARAVVNTFPTADTKFWIYPYIWSTDTLLSVHYIYGVLVC